MIATAALALTACAAPAGTAGPDTGSTPTPTPTPTTTTTETVRTPQGAFIATVDRIVDGDTLWIVMNEATADHRSGDEVKLRLLRIDTPELARDGRPEECLAGDARELLEDMAPPGTDVRGAYDTERTDRFGRDLVQLWNEDGRWVNGAMLESGLATVVTFRPNDGYEQEVRDREAAARAADRGLWDTARC